MENYPETVNTEKTENLSDWSFLKAPETPLPDENTWQCHRDRILACTIYAPWYHEISWFNLSVFFVLSCYSLVGSQVIFAAGDSDSIFAAAREIIFNSSKISSPINLTLVYASLFFVGSFLFFQSINEKEI
jgi:hypothetical protein